MLTISYRGAWVHLRFDRDQCVLQWPDYTLTHCKSLHAAKCLIGRRRNKTLLASRLHG